MATSFNPFPQRQYPKSQTEALFGKKSDAKLAQKTRIENPALYESIRKQAVADGLVSERPVPYSAWRMPSERKFSDAEIAARAKYSKAECQELFGKSGQAGGTNNAGNLFKNDPAKYQAMRTAAVSYNLIPESQPAPKIHADKPATEPEGFVLSDAIADKINLPHGTRVTTEQFAKITTILNPVSNADTKE